MKKPKLFNILIVLLFIVCLATVIVFGVPGVLTFRDETFGKLFSATVPRLAAAIVLIVLMLNSDYALSLKPKTTTIGYALLWSIPCFAVAVVNFPFTALIGGAATIDRTDLIWIFLLKCFSIALMEELFFRAILLPFFQNQLKNRTQGTLFSVLLSSALFAIMHLINLFFGAGVGATILQVGYTFLIGCMLAVMLLKTKNIWLCVIVHFLFDIGGVVITDLGHGPFQDVTFWILTTVAGVICAIHIIFTLFSLTNQQNK